jgi:hypothetical protein
MDSARERRAGRLAYARHLGFVNGKEAGPSSRAVPPEFIDLPCGGLPRLSIHNVIAQTGGLTRRRGTDGYLE